MNILGLVWAMVGLYGLFFLPKESFNSSLVFIGFGITWIFMKKK